MALKGSTYEGTTGAEQGQSPTVLRALLWWAAGKWVGGSCVDASGAKWH